MKKRNLFTILMLAVLIVIGTACNKSSHDEDTEEELSPLEAALEILNQKEADSILEHYDDGTITKSEISKAIEMCDAYIDVNCIEVEEAISKFDTFDEAVNSYENKMEKHDIWYVAGLYEMLEMMDEEEMGTANYKKFLKMKEKNDKSMEKINRKMERKFGQSFDTVEEAESATAVEMDSMYYVPAVDSTASAYYPVDSMAVK
ncbi:MAG: hypothetical protein NC402_07210 [Prevotella sp.]|nr:hypothetical protein [Prevotella sp.]MCM1074335.1 hypothetical protein [Ruminococcus sp.]